MFNDEITQLDICRIFIEQGDHILLKDYINFLKSKGSKHETSKNSILYKLTSLDDYIDNTPKALESGEICWHSSTELKYNKKNSDSYLTCRKKLNSKEIKGTEEKIFIIVK